MRYKIEQKACQSSYVCEGFSYISGLSHRIRKIFCINFHDNKIPLSETRDDLGEDKFNPRHMSISLSFMSFFSYFNQKIFFWYAKNKYATRIRNKESQLISEFTFSTITSKLWNSFSWVNTLFWYDRTTWNLDSNSRVVWIKWLNGSPWALYCPFCCNY